MNQHVSYTYGMSDWLASTAMPEIVRGDGNHILACPRQPVAKWTHIIPIKYIEALEHNQQISSCCRHPENHDITAWYSSDEDAAKGIPDIYIFHCPCGRDHRRFCVGGGEKRPFWECR